MNKNERLFKSNLFCVLALSLILCSTSAFAGIINVPGDFAKIQGAIDAASSGDTVIVAAGTYAPSTNSEVFPINMKDGVSLQGAGEGVCILDAEGTDGVIYCVGISDTTTAISGFTIRNGVTGQGGGIFCLNYSSPTISNCIVMNNSATNGGGICCRNYSNAKITSCTITGNSASGYRGGGGIDCRFNSSPYITNCIITDNSSSSFGGGIFAYDGGRTQVTNCTIKGNYASRYGGGIDAWSSRMYIHNCIVTGNSAGIRWGGIYSYQSNVQVYYTDIWGNSLPEYLVSYVGPGCIFVNPQFVGVSDPDPLNWDLHLQASSPCIDVGINSAIGIPTTDFDGNPRILDGDGDTVAVVDMGAFEFVTPEEALNMVVDAIQDFVDSNPNTDLADMLEDTPGDLQKAIDELDQPDAQAAVGIIEGVVGKIADAVDKGLDPEEANELMDKLAGVAKQLAEDAIQYAKDNNGDAGEIYDAEQYLAFGDLLRADEAFKDAVNKYKDALSKAEGAVS